MVQMPLYELYKRGGLQIIPLESPPSPQRIAVASAGSAAIVSCLTFPLEVVRLRLQAQEMSSSSTAKPSSSPSQPKRYTGMIDAFRQIARNEGIVRGLYRGLSSSLFRTIPNSMVIMVSYESVLRFTSALVASFEDNAITSQR
jgi:Mitochondrial carrier protein